MGSPKLKLCTEAARELAAVKACISSPGPDVYLNAPDAGASMSVAAPGVELKLGR